MTSGKATNLEWSEQYSVGISLIDDQHKLLFSLVKQLSDAMTQAKGRQAVAELLHKAVDYVLVHFQTEERLMEQSAFPQLDEHREEHRSFIRTMLELNDKVKLGNVLVANEMQQFLYTWINHHVLVTDQAYASHIRQYLSANPQALG